MPNGGGLMGGTSSTQSSIIVPFPGNDSLFYVFTSDEFQSYNTPGKEKGYRYNIVNICLDNGKGDISSGQKNILLLDSATEKLAACEDANGTGYWVLGHKMFSDQFAAWHLTSLGIDIPVISHIGTIQGWDNIHKSWNNGMAQGQMKVNPMGTKLALVVGNSNPGFLDLFDFNSSTGVVSNPCHIVIDSALQKLVYGVEFSPDGSKLYVGSIGGSGGAILHQFNLLAGNGNCDSVHTSINTIFESHTSYAMDGMQLATDGKIYLVGHTYYDLSCINSPNLMGIASNFDSAAISLNGINNMTLPSFIAGYRYHNGIPSCPSITGIDELKNRTIAVFPNPSNGKFDIQSQEEIKSVEIHNILGERIYYKLLTNKQQNVIDISSEPAGIYFVLIRTDIGMTSKKIVVIK